MSSRDELLKSIADIIKDYRAGEISPLTAEHVDRWVRQFDGDVQIPLLVEVEHVFKKTYFGKKFVTDFFANQITNVRVAGDSPVEFWKAANLLNIQQNGNSQREIVELFGESLKAHLGISISDCGSPNGTFVYLDDALFSGRRIETDLKGWVEESAPQEATVYVLVIGAYRYGEWNCKNRLKEFAAKAGKAIKFTFWAAARLENRRTYKNKSEVLWPVEIPDDINVTAYMKPKTNFNFEARTVGGRLEYNVFSGESGRQLLEREMLLAGARILSGCQSAKKSIRPLGFGPFELGFGATIVTYRNCPNNCPLAFWWGDPNATSGSLNWYPLLPRKTYDSDLSNLRRRISNLIRKAK